MPAPYVNYTPVLVNSKPLTPRGAMNKMSDFRSSCDTDKLGFTGKMNNEGSVLVYINKINRS